MILSAEEFVQLRTSVNPADYLRAASEEAAGGVWLEVIEQYPDMRFWVAQNKTVPVGILEKLAMDADARVRYMVASKNKLTPELLELLSRDPDPTIRERIARNKKCSKPVLERLSTDPTPAVASAAQEHLRGDS
jgi:hypothetical protein